MAGQSGKNGKVLAGATTIAEVTGWTYNPTSSNPAWASSSKAGRKQRVGGVRDSSGTFDFKYDTTDRIHAILTPGDEVTLNLYSDASDIFVVPVVIDGITYEVDINDGEVTGGTCSYSQTDDPTYPT